MTLASFEYFVAANTEPLLRIAHLITLDQGEAEDLVQECLLKIAQRWERVGAMEQPFAYARKVLVNLAVRGSRKRSRRRAELGHAVIPERVDSVATEDVEIREELLTGLRALGSRQRAVMVLRFFCDLSDAQIADALGCTASTVRSTIARSLAQLRNTIESAPSQRGAKRDE